MVKTIFVRGEPGPCETYGQGDCGNEARWSRDDHAFCVDCMLAYLVGERLITFIPRPLLCILHGDENCDECVPGGPGDYGQL